ncbi:MAG TPA: ABC transporter ATP-binding protein [Elusimicrobiota bacterium]|nr:ABC transporter ATP-binding protein [Elusimicrobiota bacterium]
MIEAAQLVKHYAGAAGTYTALKGVSFRVERGEFAAVMGPSGCGKSTLLNVLGLLDHPSSGEYRIDGARASELEDAERTRLRREKIGFVFQSFNLLPRLSALENVCLPTTYAGVPRAEGLERAAGLLGRVGLGAKHHHSPLQLSGGERQRVGLARALANRPALLLADEPTGNLDSRTSAEILELLGELHKEGMTLLVVTHDRGVAERAQRIIHLHDGAVEREERP